jgi:ParB family chromosome partitioning protein
MKKPVLGRGFEGLIPIGFDVNEVAGPAETIKEVAVEKVHINPDQPRKHFDEEKLEELALSIKQHGVIQPLVVTPASEGYRIVAGERRYRASKIAKLQKIPVIVRNHQELEELEIALVENVQRVDLSPLEQAVSIVRLRDQFSLTPTQIAKKLGKAETTISNIVRLLHLPKSAIEALQKGIISEGHGRALLSLKDDVKAQSELEALIQEKSLSVRDAEAWVKDYKKQKEQKSSSENKELKQNLERLEKKGLRVKVQQKKKGGVVSIAYKTDAELLILLSQI